MAGEDIAQGIPAELSKMNPVGAVMNAAQGGGQQILDLLMKLFQQQQQPQAPLPFVGNPISGQGQQQDLRSRMTSVPPGGTY